MNVIQTSQVLARIQAYHGGFEVTKEKVAAWFELLEPYEFRDCIEAVKDYFRHPGDWIMPSDIISRVKETQQLRLASFKDDLRLNDADERDSLEHGGWQAAQRKLWSLAANGHIAPDDYREYKAGRVQLSNFSRKEIGR